MCNVAEMDAGRKRCTCGMTTVHLGRRLRLDPVALNRDIFLIQKDHVNIFNLEMLSVSKLFHSNPSHDGIRVITSLPGYLACQVTDKFR